MKIFFSSFGKMGKDVILRPLSKIVNTENISIGNSVIVDDFVFINGGKRTEIKNFVHIASFVSITGGGELLIEDFSGISSGCRIFTGNDDYSGKSLTGPTIPHAYRNVIRSHVHIKKHVVVGANSVILPGVVIGEGACVGANSLVKTDLKPWTIYAGSPAKPIQVRPKELIYKYEEKLKAEKFDHIGNYISNNETDFIINYL